MRLWFAALAAVFLILLVSGFASACLVQQPPYVEIMCTLRNDLFQRQSLCLNENCTVKSETNGNGFVYLEIKGIPFVSKDSRLQSKYITLGKLYHFPRLGKDGNTSGLVRFQKGRLDDYLNIGRETEIRTALSSACEEDISGAVMSELISQIRYGSFNLGEGLELRRTLFGYYVKRITDENDMLACEYAHDSVVDGWHFLYGRVRPYCDVREDCSFAVACSNFTAFCANNAGCPADFKCEGEYFEPRRDSSHGFEKNVNPNNSSGSIGNGSFNKTFAGDESTNPLAYAPLLIVVGISLALVIVAAVILLRVSQPPKTQK